MICSRLAGGVGNTSAFFTNVPLFEEFDSVLFFALSNLVFNCLVILAISALFKIASAMACSSCSISMLLRRLLLLVR